MTKITIKKGDITKEKVDVIVNAANKTLLGGGGVDGAIHRVAGPDLLRECRTLKGCDTGEAKITKGYRLSTKYIIHTVGPIYGNENGKEPELLSSCYKSSLLLAKEYNLKTIAFPAISTGVYGYPKNEATKIALNTIQEFIKHDKWFNEIRFILYSDESLEIYNEYYLKSKASDL